MFLPFFGYSQFCGLENEVVIENFRRDTIELDIASFVNNDLSDPGQGLCEVRLNFRHTDVRTMDLWVVSPNGDVVQLIGPMQPGSFDFNPNNFDIGFVDCSAMAEPDLFQTDTWSNINLFSAPEYNGRYFPSGGCFSDFNAGPVNGTWLIIFEVNDIGFGAGPYPTPVPSLVSQFYDVELIFCDDEGNPCCDANAGTFNDLPLVVCEGDPALEVSPVPFYTATVPDTLEYGFTYLVFKNGILDNLTDAPDLTTAGAGDYEICGLSYRLSDSLNLPDPADNLLLTDLRSDLASNSSAICADLSTNCLEVTIVGPSETILNESICQGASFTVGTSTYTTAGNFTDVLQNVIGCDSIIRLNLTVLDELRDTIYATICSGDAYDFGGLPRTTAGFYEDTLLSVEGCDSIVTLNLSVASVLVMDSIATICQGDLFVVGDSTFSSAGIYQVPSTTVSGCDSILRVDLRVIAPDVVFAEPDTISCNNTVVTLDGSASMPAGGVGFTWLDDNDQVIGNTATLDVNRGGLYSLIVTQNQGTAFCTNRDTIIVEADTIRPVADAGPPDTLTCAQPQAVIGTFNSSQEADVLYEWASPDGNIVSGADQIQALVNAPGTYTLTVRKTTNGCTDISVVTIAEDGSSPTAIIADPAVLNCFNDSIQLDASGSSSGPNIIYLWTATGGSLITDPDSLRPFVFSPDTYQLEVTDTITGCAGIASVSVMSDQTSPAVQIAPVSDTLTCQMNTLVMDGTGSDSGPGYSFRWRALNGGQILSGGSTLTPTIGAGGTYRLIVQDLINGCTDSAEVVVEEDLMSVMAVIAKSNDLTCALNTATLDAKGSFPLVGGTYRWSTVNGNITSNEDEDFITVNQPGVYQVVVQDLATGCEDSTAVEVLLIDDLPVVEAGGGFTLTCTTPEAPLNSAGSSSGPEFDYAWTGPCIVSGENTAAPIVNCGGTYILTITNLNTGCSNQDSVVILDDSAPPVADAGPDTVLNCLTPIIRLDGTNAASGPGIDYQWSGPGFLDGENTNQPLIDQPGIYVLDLINTITGCTNSDTVTVALDTLSPMADAGSPQLVDCNTPVVLLGGAGSSTGPDLVYEWSSPDGNFTGPVDSIFSQTDSAGIFQLKITNTRNGCADSSSVSISYNQNFPVADAGADQALNCLVESVTLGNEIGATDVTYNWTGSACFLTDTNLSSVQVDCGGTYILEVQDLNSGCISSDTVVVTQDTVVPSAVLPPAVSIDCGNGLALLDGSASGGGQLSWFFDNNIIARDTDQVAVSEAGIYQLIVQDTILGCSDTAAVEVLFDCTVEALIATPGSLTCDRQIVLLDAGSSMAGSDAVGYFWRGPEDNCILEGRDSSIAEVACAGTYTVVVTNLAIGLSDSASVQVTIDTLPPVANAGFPDTLTCDQLTATLDASGSVTSPFTSYIWYTFEGDTLSTELTTTVDSAGIYLFEITDNNNGCTATDGVEIRRNIFVPDVSFENLVFPCDPDTLQLQGVLSSMEGALVFNWSGPSILGNADSLDLIVGAGGAYTLLVANTDNGCVRQLDIEVIEEDCPPCVSAGSPDTITCTSPEVRLAATLCEACNNCSFSWQTTNGNIVSGSNTLTPLVDDPGIYTLVVSDNDNGLSTTIRIEVFGDTIPPLVNAGGDQDITCSNPLPLMTGVFSGAGANPGFRWFEQGNSSVSLSNTSELQVSREGVYLFEVTNTQNGCVGIDAVVIGLDTLTPNAVAGPAQTITCDNTFARLEGENSSSGADITYQWTAGPGGNIQTGGNSVNPIVNQPGVYFLRVSNIVNGCSELDSMVVLENTDPPLLQPLGDEVLNCSRPTALLQGSLPANGSFSFQWCLLDAQGDTLSCQNTLDLSVDEPGVYAFTVRDQNTGCSSEEVVRVTADTVSPVVDATVDGQFNCRTVALNLEGVVISGETNIDIEWSNPDNAPISGAASLQPAISEPGRYFLRVENRSNGCVGIDSVTVTLDDRFPIITVNPQETITCSERQVRLTASADAANGQLSAVWATSDGQIVGSFDVLNPRVRSAGTYYLVVTDLVNNCIAVDSVIVEEDFRAPELSVDTLAGTVITCFNPEIEADLSSSTSATGLALTFEYRQNGALLPDNGSALRVTTPGNFVVIGTDPGNGCRDTVRFRISENTRAPEVSIIDPEALNCLRNTSIIDATNSAQGPQYRYTWSGPGRILASGSMLEVQVDAGGVYELTIADTINGCSNTAEVALPVDTLSPRVNIADPLLLDCQDILIELDGRLPGANGLFTYAWSSAAGGQIVSGSNGPVAQVDSSGVYVLEITNTRNGCTGRGSITVEGDLQPIEDVDFTISPPDCLGDGTGSITVNQVSGGVGPFAYAVNSEVFLTRNFFDNLAPETMHVLRVMDARGCVVEYDFSFPEITPLEVALGPDQNIDLGDSIRIEALVNRSYDSLRWTPAGQSGNPSEPMQVLKPLETTVYKVFVTDSLNCTAVGSVVITVNTPESLFFPTAFSPDGNGNNDVYYIFADDDVRQIRSFFIFDRWGTRVFEQTNFQPNDPNFGWDGSFRGKKMKPAVFVFTAEVEYIDGRVELLKGDFVLLNR